MVGKVTSLVKADPGWTAGCDQLTETFPIVAWAASELTGGSFLEAVVVDRNVGEVMLLSELLWKRQLPSEKWMFTR